MVESSEMTGHTCVLDMIEGKCGEQGNSPRLAEGQGTTLCHLSMRGWDIKATQPQRNCNRRTAGPPERPSAGCLTGGTR